jgi:CheY-like chemotaxis protein
VENPTSPILKTILLVDHADDCRLTTKWFLANFGYAVDSVRSAEEAPVRFYPKIHAVIVSDNSLAGMTGSEMAYVIKLSISIHPSTDVHRTAVRKSILRGFGDPKTNSPIGAQRRSRKTSC